MSESFKILSLIFFFSLLSLLSNCSRNDTDKVSRDLYFFYMELCPSCEEYQFADELASRVTDMGGTALNIILDEDALKMKEILTEKGLSRISHVLPLLVEGEEYTVGYEDIFKKIETLSKE